MHIVYIFMYTIHPQHTCLIENKRVKLNNLQSSETIHINIGSGGNSNINGGKTGGTTSFGKYVSANGGSGGSNNGGGNGGSGGGGTGMNFKSQAGGKGYQFGGGGGGGGLLRYNRTWQGYEPTLNFYGGTGGNGGKWGGGGGSTYDYNFTLNRNTGLRWSKIMNVNNITWGIGGELGGNGGISNSIAAKNGTSIQNEYFGNCEFDLINNPIGGSFGAGTETSNHVSGGGGGGGYGGAGGNGGASYISYSTSDNMCINVIAGGGGGGGGYGANGGNGSDINSKWGYTDYSGSGGGGCGYGGKGADGYGGTKEQNIFGHITIINLIASGGGGGGYGPSNYGAGGGGNAINGFDGKSGICVIQYYELQV